MEKLSKYPNYTLYVPFASSQSVTLRPWQHLKTKFDVMLHQVNAHFPGTDPLFKRAANIQRASAVQLYGCTGFRNQNRKPQTNRNTKKIGNKSIC